MYKGIIRDRTDFMKYKNKFICIFIMNLLLLLGIGCTSENSEYETNQISNIGSKEITYQQPANEAKQFLSDYEEVAHIYAVHHDKDLLIAIDIDHEDRFQLDSLEKKFREKLNNHFEKFNIALSTDQKLLFEIEELEHEISDGTTSDKDLNKKMKKLKKLMKEKT